MSRPRPPYLVRDVSRHGRVRWYFRRPGAPKVRLPDEYGSQAFQAAYAAALAGKAAATPKPSRRGNAAGSLAWLVERYMETSTWADLSPATRRQRSNILKRVVAKKGDIAAADVDTTMIEDTIEARRATPFAARNFVETMRGLLRWAKKAKHIEIDPTEGVKVSRKTTDGFPQWTEEDVARFEARWPLGTRERLAFDLLLWTGFRRGDAVRVGRQHVKAGCITLRTEKTDTDVVIPVLPALAESIAAGPTGDLHFIVGASGRPMRKESFGNWFKAVCVKTGLPNRSAHGLRKLSASRFAEAGATPAQLDSWFGWSGGQMASHYTKKADRARMARATAALLSHPNSGGTVHPQGAEKKGA